MDEFDLLPGDVCDSCRHTLRDDRCPACGWQPEWAALSGSESDPASAGIATRAEDVPASLSGAPRREEGITLAPRRLPGDDLPGIRGW